jgi:hypothetical protein
MHGDDFEVDAERLASRAAEFAPLADRVNGIHRNLADALSTGQCWGTDAVGQSFNDVHATPADDATTRLSALSTRLRSLSTRLTETATTYQSGDQSAVDNVKAAEQ